VLIVWGYKLVERERAGPKSLSVIEVGANIRNGVSVEVLCSSSPGPKAPGSYFIVVRRKPKRTSVATGGAPKLCSSMVGGMSFRGSMFEHCSLFS
jgi:hypothetical protein